MRLEGDVQRALDAVAREDASRLALVYLGQFDLGTSGTRVPRPRGARTWLAGGMSAATRVYETASDESSWTLAASDAAKAHLFAVVGG